MKTNFGYRGCFLASLILSLLIPVLAIAQPTGEEVARQVFHRDVGKDLQMAGTMELISGNGHSRIREYLTLRKDTSSERKVLISFTAPADIAGTGFLILENTEKGDTQQHLYLPALKRTRRIVASQKGRSFVNSDFTYEDMQRQPIDDWTYQLGADTEYLGESCFSLVSRPKQEDKTQYSKIVTWVDKKHFMPLRSEFWDKKGRHTKTYRVEQFEIIDGIATETNVVMEDLSAQHSTRLQNHKISYNSNLPDHLFTIRALER